MELSLEHVTRILKNILKTNFEVRYIKSLFSPDGAIGFLSASGRWVIGYKTKTSEGELKIFTKHLPKSGFLRTFIIESEVFQRESLCYSLLLKELEVLTDQHPFPKFYFSSLDDLLVLEDLCSEGFQMRDIHQPLDLAHCKVSLKALAKLHGSSIAFEIRNGVKLNAAYPEILCRKMNISPESRPPTSWHEAGMHTIETLTGIYFPNKYSSQVLKAGFEFITNFSSHYENFLKYPCVLINGDCWGGNIMFKYSGDGSPLEACIFDFQLCKYSLPTLDFIFFIYVTTRKQFRQLYLQQLIEYYYSELKAQLSSTNIDIGTVLSSDLLGEMITESLPHVLAKAALYLHFVLISESKMNHLRANESEFSKLYGKERCQIVLELMQEEEEFRNRVLESISEFYDCMKDNTELQDHISVLA